MFRTTALLLVCLFSVQVTEGFVSINKTNTWAIILSSSRYFFNLRHTTNALAMYHLCRKHGMDDDQILVFLSDSYACDPRKSNPATIYGASSQEQANLYGCNIRVDYASYDVGVRRFLGVLQGRYDENTPPSRRFNTDENSNIIIYAAGHSAEGFFKFQDLEFMSSTDIADTLMMMWEQRRYRKVVFLVDTCRALSLCLEIKAPNVICLASSEAHLDSYSHHLDPPSGFTVITRWTYEFLEVLKDSKCRPEKGTVTALQKSFYDFNYGPERLSLPKPLSEPAHYDAVNRPNAVRDWKMDEFFCEQERSRIPVQLRYDLF